MLQLTSELWGKLTGPYESGEQVPELLERLLLDFDKEVLDELFQEHLYHQNTIYTVTYATVPYLAQLALASKNTEVRHEIYVSCGIIESCHEKATTEAYPSDWKELAAEAGNEVCAEMYQSYLNAIADLALLVPEMEQEAYLWPSGEGRRMQAFAEDPVFEPLQAAHAVTPVETFIEAEHRVLAERAEQLFENESLI